MRVLGPIVPALPLLVPRVETKPPDRSTVGTKLVRHDGVWHPQRLLHQTDSSGRVSPRLHHHVENLTLPVVDLGAQLEPIGGGQSRQPVDLLDQEHIARLAVAQQPEQASVTPLSFSTCHAATRNP